MANVTVDEWVKETQRRIEAVVKTAAQSVATESNKAVGAGGQMRVDTGFLRASQAGQVGSMPSGETAPDKATAAKDKATAAKDKATAAKHSKARDAERKKAQAVAANEVSFKLLAWDLKDPFYIGWTANYARYREMHDGFLKTQTQNWQKHVDAAAAKAKARNI